MSKSESTRIPAVAVTFHDAAGAEVRIDEGPTVMRFTYADGEVDLVTLAELTASANYTTFAWHGAKQKAIDAAAISRDPETGRAASVGTKREACREAIRRALAGDWFKNRGEGGTGTGGLLYRALCRLYAETKTPEAIREWLNGKTDAEQAALRKNSKVAAMIETIRAESAKADGIDSEGLLGELA